MSWAVVGQIAGELANTALQSSAQHKANRTNIKMAREQRAWETEMSNTAVQRRANDLRMAGGNPALAFTTAAAASTPSVQTPSVESTLKQSDLGGAVGRALLLKEQLNNIRSDTAAKAADARTKQVDATIKEDLYEKERDFKANRYVENVEWDDLRTKILRSTESGTAAEAKRQKETVDSLIALAKQQAAKGQLDLEALRNIAQVGGIEAGKLQPLLKLLSDIILRSENK